MSSKTVGLRKIITEQLQTVPGGTYHRHASPSAVFPYKVYSMSTITFPDSARDDISLIVDVWDRNASQDPKTAEGIADQIEQIFNCANLPRPPLYPTFFRDTRNPVEDPDKELIHIQLRFSVQLYA